MIRIWAGVQLAEYGRYKDPAALRGLSGSVH